MKERKKQPSTYQQPARQKSESPPDERSALTPIRAPYLTGQDVLNHSPRLHARRHRDVEILASSGGPLDPLPHRLVVRAGRELELGDIGEPGGRHEARADVKQFHAERGDLRL